MEDDNVLIFPRAFAPQKVRGTLDVKSFDDIKNNIALLHAVYINTVIETIYPIISNQLLAAGFRIGPDASLKDGALFVESLRAMLSKQYGIYHPFNKLADALFEETEQSLRLVDKLDITLTRNANTS